MATTTIKARTLSRIELQTMAATMADGGTLFLDEVGETPPALQPKLLRVLQDGVVERVGSNRRREVNVRLVSATNRNLEESIRAGQFRRDLFYRIRVVEIALPALRDRREDIPFLVAHFLRRFARADEEAPASPRARCVSWRAIPGRGTCASSRTSSSAPSCCAAVERSAPGCSTSASPAYRRPSRARSGSTRRWIASSAR